MMFTIYRLKTRHPARGWQTFSPPPGTIVKDSMISHGKFRFTRKQPADEVAEFLTAQGHRAEVQPFNDRRGGPPGWTVAYRKSEDGWYCNTCGNREKAEAELEKYRGLAHEAELTSFVFHHEQAWRNGSSKGSSISTASAANPGLFRRES